MIGRCGLASRYRSLVQPYFHFPSTAPRAVSPPELGLETTRRDTPRHADNTTSPCRGGLTAPSGGDVCRTGYRVPGTAYRDRDVLRGRARDVPRGLRRALRAPRLVRAARSPTSGVGVRPALDYVRRVAAGQAIAGGRGNPAAGGKSELRRAGCRVTPGESDLEESATENRPPRRALREGKEPPARMGWASSLRWLAAR